MSIAQRLSKFALGVDAQGVLSAAKGGTGNTTGTASGGSASGGPKIASIVVTDSSYTTLDDTAVDIAGGYIKLTGSGFETGCQVLVGNTPASSTTFVSSTEVRAQLPATTAGSYVVYLVNSDGGTAIRVNGVNFSTTPLWTTDSAISGIAGAQISIQLLASGASTFSVASGSTLPSGVTLSSTGLLSGTVTGVTQQTVYSFTILATDAEQQDSPRTFAFTLSVGDPLFKYTTLLLTGNGTDTAQNNTFVDSSTNALAVTRTGNSTQGAFSPYGASWSNYFAGNESLQTPANSITSILGTNGLNTTSVVTVECWVYQTQRTTTETSTVVGEFIPNSGILNWGFGPNNNGVLSLRWWVGATNSCVGNTVIPLNTWTHIALVVNAANIKMFVNGVQQTLTGTTTFTNPSDATMGYIAMGKWNNGGTGYAYYGNISNLRITKAALYSANFTPSATPLTPTTNTGLLTCQSSGLIDNSYNNHPLTVTSAPSTQKFSPFSNTTQTPQTYSTLFDGSGDTLYTSANPSITGNFTVECWVYPTSTATRVFIYGTQKTAYVADYGILLDTNGGTVCITGGGGNGTFISASFAGNAAAPQNQWSHIALVRNSGTLTAYLNGVPGTGVAASGTIAPYLTRGDLSGALGYWLGTNDSNWTVQNYTYYKGSISNFRFVTGTAIYTSAFTPPTSALTAISGTQLLTCQDSTLRDNSTNNYSFSIGGDTKPSRYNPFGYTTSSAQEYSPSVFGASAYFDGSGDYLEIADNINLRLETGDFTIELWWYPTTLSGTQEILTKGSGLQIYTVGGGVLAALSASNTTTYFITGGSTNALVVNAWNHIALTRSGNNFNIYLNGVRTNLGTSSSSIDTGTDPLFVAIYKGSPYYYTSGYISDVRVVKGTALYTTPFIPPQAPLAPITNTTLLLKMANAGIADASGKAVIETVGDAKLSTAQKKYGNASLFFDGTGDGLYLPASTNWAIGEAVTMEGWFYFNSTGSGTLLSTYDYFSSTEFGWYLSVNGSAKLQFACFGNGGSYGGNHNAINITGATTLATGQWYHIAFVKNGTSGKIYLNGIQDASGTFSESNTESRQLGIAMSFTGNGSRTSFAPSCYIDDLRITKGYAHYTANFTPPQQALPTL